MQYPRGRRARSAAGIPVCSASAPARAALAEHAQALSSTFLGPPRTGCLHCSGEAGLLTAGSARTRTIGPAGSSRGLSWLPTGARRGAGGGIPPVRNRRGTGMHRLPGLSSKARISETGAIPLGIWESIFFFICVIAITGLYGLVAYFLYQGRWAELCLHGQLFSSASGAFSPEGSEGFSRWVSSPLPGRKPAHVSTKKCLAVRACRSSAAVPGYPEIGRSGRRPPELAGAGRPHVPRDRRHRVVLPESAADSALTCDQTGAALPLRAPARATTRLTSRWRAAHRVERASRCPTWMLPGCPRCNPGSGA